MVILARLLATKATDFIVLTAGAACTLGDITSWWEGAGTGSLTGADDTGVFLAGGSIDNADEQAATVFSLDLTYGGKGANNTEAELPVSSLLAAVFVLSLSFLDVNAAVSEALPPLRVDQTNLGLLGLEMTGALSFFTVTGSTFLFRDTTLLSVSLLAVPDSSPNISNLMGVIVRFSCFPSEFSETNEIGEMVCFTVTFVAGGG